jgi:predicted MPP superfamily phosphohydrolase
VKTLLHLRSELIYSGPLLLVQVLLARRAIQRWPRFQWLVWVLAAIPFLLEFFGMPQFGGRPRMPDAVVFVLELWLYCSSAAFVVIKLGELLAGRASPKDTRPDTRRRELILGAAYAAAAVPVGALLYGSFIEREKFSVSEVSLRIPNLPSDFEGFQILQISDVHRSAFLSQRDLRRVVDAARGIHPDLIAHTGDFISTMGDPLEDCLDQLAELHAGYGVFGCLGNHETYAEVEDYATRYAGRRGILILRSQNRLIQRGNSRLNIAGVDYQNFSRKTNYIPGADKLVVPGATNILLSHNPDVFPTAAQKGFDAMLAGHTHGGQVRVEILHVDVDFARVYTPYVSGVYYENGRACYVTRGVGSIGVPSRLGAPPEISLVRLTRRSV